MRNNAIVLRVCFAIVAWGSVDLSRATKTIAAPPIAQTYFNQGLAHYQTGSLKGFQAAQRDWEKALKLWQDQGDRLQQSVTRNFLCLTYENLGNYTQSRTCYQQLLALARSLQDPQTQATTLMAIARLENRLGNYQNAIDTLNLALPLWQRVKFKTGEISTQNEMGLVYLNLGDWEQAIEIYQQALDKAINLGNAATVASLYHNLSQAYLEAEDWEKALTTEQQALERWQSLITQLADKATPDIQRGQAASLNSQAFIQTQLKQYPQAFIHYDQALKLWQKIGDRSGEASTLNNLGDLARLQNQLPQALNFYQQALKLRQTIGDRPKEAISRYSLANLYYQQGNLPQAKQEIEKALEIIEILRSNVKNQDLRTSFLSSKQDYYRFYIDLLMELHRRFPKQGWDAKALAVSERSKARSLLDILAQTSGQVTKGISPQLLAQKNNLEQQLDALEKQRIQLFNQPNTLKERELQKQELEQAIENLSQQYQRLLNQISLSSPSYASLTQPKTLTLSQIQGLLDPQTMLLEYALGTKKSYLWVVTTHSLQSYELPDETTLTQGVKDFRDSFLMPSQRLRQSRAIRSGYRLKNWLFPTALKLQHQRLAIVPDGALQYLPFAALSNSDKLSSDLTYLIDDHELVSLPSASVLKRLRQEARTRKPASKSLAVFADPVFNINDERLKSLGLKIPANLAADLVRSARESGVFFERLPFTQTEAQGILALLPGRNRLQEFGFSANRSRSLNTELSDYQFIHFATHGLLNSQSPQLSGLVFSLFDQQGRSQNGFLRLYDIFNLKLPAELVVLSACKTGLGKTVKGEGLIGLTRGFMYAGANRVVVSLWSVDDQATSLLMIKFYQGMWQQKLSPAAALQAAQKSLKADKVLASPYYWAAFTLQGEWHGLNRLPSSTLKP
ncbi:MAG: CHAT domain-containing protein [Snowella sp.]|nr:CHAT domain-containing protein [Snowella sp.]